MGRTAMKWKEISRERAYDPIVLYSGPLAIYAAAYYQVTYSYKVGKITHIGTRLERGATLQLGLPSCRESEHLKQLARIAADAANTLREACFKYDEALKKRVKKGKIRGADD